MLSAPFAEMRGMANEDQDFDNFMDTLMKENPDAGFEGDVPLHCNPFPILGLKPTADVRTGVEPITFPLQVTLSSSLCSCLACLRPGAAYSKARAVKHLRWMSLVGQSKPARLRWMACQRRGAWLRLAACGRLVGQTTCMTRSRTSLAQCKLRSAIHTRSATPCCLLLPSLSMSLKRQAREWFTHTGSDSPSTAQ